MERAYRTRAREAQRSFTPGLRNASCLGEPILPSSALTSGQGQLPAENVPWCSKHAMLTLAGTSLLCYFVFAVGRGGKGGTPQSHGL